MADSSDELNSRLADLRVRHDEAQEAAHAAREERSRVAGLRVLGEADAEALSVASGALQSAETDASDLASAVVLLEARIANAATDAAELAAAALRGKGKKLAAARDAAIVDFREQASAAAAAVARWDKAQDAIAELREQAIGIFDPEAHQKEIDAEIRGMVDAAPAGQFLNPAILDRREQEGREQVVAGAQAAADAVGWVTDDSTLRAAAAAAGLPAERLLQEQHRLAISEGFEFLAAPPAPEGSVGNRRVTRIYGSGEISEAYRRFTALRSALLAIADPAPTIADSYRSVGGSTVSSAA